MTTKTIRMLVDGTGAHGEPLVQGKTYELEAASADHWLKREKAVLVEDHTKVPTSKEVKGKKADDDPATKKKAEEEAANKAKAEKEAAEKKAAEEAAAKLKGGK